jgi:hypothetical protein
MMIKEADQRKRQAVRKRYALNETRRKKTPVPDGDDEMCNESPLQSENGNTHSAEQSSAVARVSRRSGERFRGSSRVVSRDRRGCAAVDVTAWSDGNGSNGGCHGRGAGDGVGSAVRDLEDLAVGGADVEVGLRERDLVVLEVVDHVCGAQESVAKDGGRVFCGGDSEDADGFALVDAGDDDEFVESDADGWSGEGEVDAA